MTAMTDELATLAAIAAGDSVAFGRWLSTAERPVRASLRSFAALVDTEAVLQEAFLRVWQVAPRVVHDGKANVLLRLAMTTARNCAISELRKRPTSASTPEALERAINDTASFNPSMPDPHLRELIQHCREQLPKQPGIAFEQRMVSQGHDDDATLAQRAGMALNTFLQNFSRARKFLAECLKKRGVDLEGELSP